MNKLVKIIEHMDCEVDGNEYWHLSHPALPDPAILCTGEFYELERVSSERILGNAAALAEEKLVKKGGVTCPECLAFIKSIKAVKL